MDLGIDGAETITAAAPICSASLLLSIIALVPLAVVPRVTGKFPEDFMIVSAIFVRSLSVKRAASPITPSPTTPVHPEDMALFTKLGIES